MTAKRLSRIIGYENIVVHQVPRDGAVVGYRATACGTPTCSEDGKSEQEALAKLHWHLYRWNCQIVLARDGYKCVLCSARTQLQIDHIKPRSKGRDDRPINMRTLCAAHHEARHKKRSGTI